MTPSGSRRNSPDSPALLLIAVSARALAAAARRAGYAAIAIDAFGDDDTRAVCCETVVVENAMGGFADVALEPIVARLCAAHAPAGLVYGSGFDDCPKALDPLAQHARILGWPTGLARAKSPRWFATICKIAGIKHPKIRVVRPENASQWLIKRSGGSGGVHIAPAEAWRALRRGEYWQRRVEGRAVSLLFVRDPLALTPIAWSEQWTAPSPGAPFRYGGAAGPIDIETPLGFMEKLAALTLWIGVRGLASADFIDDGETFWLLEINPRPGATLDLFDDDEDPLLARHIAALTDGPAAPAKTRAPAAAAVVYAEADAIAPKEVWPEWVADRPAAGTSIPTGMPVCTVMSRAASAAEAKATVQQRSRFIRSWLRAGGR
jgi:uncharacterized protein